MNQVGSNALRLAHPANSRRDPAQVLAASVTETSTSEEQAALTALRDALAQSSNGLERILLQIRGPACGW